LIYNKATIKPMKESRFFWIENKNIKKFDNGRIAFQTRSFSEATLDIFEPSGLKGRKQ